MPYIDPYTLFRVASPVGFEHSKLRAISDQLLDELALQPSATLAYGTKQIFHESALKLLDDLEDPAVVQAYWRLRNMPALYDFLTYQKFEALQALDLSQLKSEEAFLNFCRPFLAAEVDFWLNQANEMQRPEHSIVLAQVAMALLEGDVREQALEAASQYLDAIVSRLASAKNQAGFEPLSIVDARWIDFLNTAPPQFNAGKQRLGQAILDWVIAIRDNPKQYQNAFKLLHLGCAVEFDGSLSADLKYFRKHFAQQLGLAEQALHSTQAYWAFSNALAEAQLAKNRKRMKRTDRFVIIAMAIGGVVLGVVMLVSALMREKGGDDSMADAGLGLPYLDNYVWRADYDMIARYDSVPTGGYTLPDFIYTLRRYHLQPQGNRVLDTLSRPFTGESPYQKLFPILDPVDAQQPFSIPFYCKNKSEKDIVLLVESMTTHTLAAHYYIRAGRQLPIGIKVPEGDYVFAIYDGYGWTDSLAKFDGRQIPGFQTQVSFVGTTPMGDRQTVPYLAIGMYNDPPNAQWNFVYENEKLSVE